MARDPGVVDEQVEAAELGDDGRQRRGDLVAVADVHLPVRDAGVARLGLARHEIGRHDLPALVAQAGSDRPAEAAGASGDDGDPAHAMLTPPSTL